MRLMRWSGILALLGLTMLMTGMAFAVDVATISAPQAGQTLYLQPVDLKILLKAGAKPETFKAWLNFSNEISTKFAPMTGGLKAEVGLADGLKVYKNSSKILNKTKGLNVLMTVVEDATGRKDMDAVWFFANQGGDESTAILTILQTSDVHHHASGYGPFLDYTPLNTADADDITGGYARLAALTNQIRSQQASLNIPVMLFDSGDFLMGTVYDLTAADPITFKFFQLMQYDAVTLGNHEFDWSPAGLALLLSRAASKGFGVPILASNTVFSATNPADDGLEYFKGTGLIAAKKIIQLPNGLKVGLLGLMGPDADAKAPVAKPVTFNHDYAFIQQKVNELRNTDGVKLVVVLSHGGVETNGSGDDADLAENVSGIDVIASGHFHTDTDKIIKVGATLIFSPGEYGEFLGRLDLAVSKGSGQMADMKWNLLPVNDSVAGDPLIQGMVTQYHAAMNANLAALGVQMDSPISRTNFSLELNTLQESGLGNLCADAGRTVASLLALPTADPTPFSLSVVPSGVIRDNLYPGKTGVITFSDIYNVLPLGISPDTSQPLPGYPLMSVYVTAPEIRNICEAGLTLAPMLGSDYFLNFSGIRVDYDPAGAFTLQGVTAVYLCGNALPAAYGGDEDIFCTDCDTALDFSDNTTLYRCVVDLYALQMMGAVTSAGLSIVPKHADGTPVNLADPADYMTCRLDAQPAAAGVQELKEWMPLLNFLGSSFPASGAGIPATVYGEGGIALGRINVMP